MTPSTRRPRKTAASRLLRSPFCLCIAPQNVFWRFSPASQNVFGLRGRGEVGLWRTPVVATGVPEVCVCASYGSKGKALYGYIVFVQKRNGAGTNLVCNKREERVCQCRPSRWRGKRTGVARSVSRTRAGLSLGAGSRWWRQPLRTNICGGVSAAGRAVAGMWEQRERECGFSKLKEASRGGGSPSVRAGSRRARSSRHSGGQASGGQASGGQALT